MEQNLSTDQKDFFSGIVANPEGIDAVHAPQLKTLVELYPQSGILRAMLARASQDYDQGGFQQRLKSAAVYAPDRGVLYNLINYPEKLVKYVEPFNEVVEEEEISLFEDDYSNYQYDEQGGVYEEETASYESEPINYFHESEEPFQYTAEDRANFNPVAEPVKNEQEIEYFSYNFPPAEAEFVQPQQEYNPYNSLPVEPEVVQQQEYNSYNFPPVEPEVVQTQEEYNAYISPPAEPEAVQPEAIVADTAPAYQPEATPVQAVPEYNYPPRFYQPEEAVKPPVVSDYDYTPPYREDDEDDEPQAPPGYTYNKPEKPAEPVLPPIPGYDTPLTYQERIAKAATEVEEEVYDEISGIEDVQVEPIVKPKSNVPDITDIEEEEIEVEEEKQDEGEEVIMAQYGQDKPVNDIPEKPKLTKAEQELADFLADSSGFAFTAPAAVSYAVQQPQYIAPEPVNYAAEEPEQAYTEPEPVAVESEVYPEPEPASVEPEVYTEPESTHDTEYITETDVDVVEEDAPETDAVDFEMVAGPVADPFSPIIPRPTPKSRPQPHVVSNALEVKPQFIADDNARVSKYNDEKMPYSFLWWLDKTRKEHAETYQPYVAFKPIITEVQRPAAGDELQQQYFENIFHITSVEQLDFNTRDKRKEGEIVDRFIQKDPQMKPPNTEKLDNENKAKNSSEDKNELVSETLARIYLDQMLYTKAISTYQKLMLKFPEKSSYFVAQIKLLEKKIN